ncbi:carbohydrate kinase [Rhizobium dioscoreae]|uniref:FGGY-family carbohydrate kinase n=1 Tax=Rhizobium TaxID=379 RepID=UPI000DDEE796|nr:MULTISPECIES: FGGY-family carbohydrate kinase [Rhizobium]MCZ3376510.1 FGGY-family carbohydrate kinase [Rhizobium sp. AG207R]TWB14522.1 sugar (pentulose or hexulose) kinase [Rhizobium sp. ERR1071]GES42222.1 carbohydrate kinase [Rhizobium dioscoreae]
MNSETAYRHIAVIDIGKTNAKVVVLDAGTGAEIAAVRTTNSVLKSGPYPHYDIESLWRFIIDALKGFAATPGFDAISITTHGASVVLLDAGGDLALPVLDYEHIYPQTVQEAYGQVRPAFAETFSPRLSGGLNAGAQIHYQQSAFPADFARVATILTYPQYWAFRLTGVAANEMTSLGCHTDLWNPTTQSYSSLVDTLGIRALMAPVRSAFDALGPVLPALAADISLSSPVPVYCGIHDSNASLLPHLVENEAPFAVVSTGTWVISFGVGGDLDHLDPARDTLANVDAYGRAVPSSRFMGGREFEILAAEIGIASHEAIEAALERVIEKGLMLLPNVVEGSGPFPGRKMRWIGSATNSAERLAAVSVYLALMTEACLDLIGAKGPIFVEGPFAFNRAYLIALSALTSTDVIALAGSTGTSQGAALLTGIRPISAAASSSTRTELPGLARYRQSWRGTLIS